MATMSWRQGSVVQLEGWRLHHHGVTVLVKVAVELDRCLEVRALVVRVALRALVWRMMDT